MSRQAGRASINVLFIGGQSSDIDEIKNYLRLPGGPVYHVEHRSDFFGSAGVLARKKDAIDIILLDLGLFGSHHSREIFKRMIVMAHGIPVIVFTNRKDHDMAVWALEDGAADNITRGIPGTDVFKFRDAIDFSLARAEIAKQLNQKNRQDLKNASMDSAMEIHSVRKSNAADMDRQKEQYAAVMRTFIERSDADVLQAVQEISQALVQSEFQNGILLARLKEYEGADAPEDR